MSRECSAYSSWPIWVHGVSRGSLPASITPSRVGLTESLQQRRHAQTLVAMSYEYTQPCRDYAFDAGGPTRNSADFCDAWLPSSAVTTTR